MLKGKCDAKTSYDSGIRDPHCEISYLNLCELTVVRFPASTCAGFSKGWAQRDADLGLEIWCTVYGLGGLELTVALEPLVLRRS